MTQLPAHLANRQRRNLTEKAVAGLGSLLPPHISIQGNTFTLIDAGGAEKPAGATLDAIILDVSDVTCKKYFDKAWEPGSNEPPTCFSANGVAPSRDAVTPQSRTCAECPHNVRGSKISAISGAAIKACRDEKWLALLIPTVGDMLFQLVLTPGSFDNWKTYNKKFEGQGIDLNDVVTKLGFVAKTNGVIDFTATTFIDENVLKLSEQAIAEKKTDALVGRTDVPWQGATAPSAAPLAAPAAAPLAATRALPSSPPLSAPLSQATPTPPVGTAPGASPSEPRQRRRRNTAPEQAPPAQAQPAMAPFRPQQAPAPAQAQPGAFGMAPGVEPDPELQSMLKGVFG